MNTHLKSLIISIISLIIASCSNGKIDTDFDNNGNGSAQKTEPKLTYTIKSLYDLPTFLDIEATYTDIDGKEQTEKVNAIPHAIEVKNFEREQKVTLKLSFTKKANIETTKTSYKFGSDITIAYLDSKGSLVDKSNNGSVDCPAAKVDEAIEHYASEGITATFDVEIP